MSNTPEFRVLGHFQEAAAPKTYGPEALRLRGFSVGLPFVALPPVGGLNLIGFLIREVKFLISMPFPRKKFIRATSR